MSLGILLIGAIGYSSQDYKTAVDAGTAAIHAYVTDDMQVKAWALYFLVPGLCMLASSIPMFFYKIDKKTKEEMRAELARRHAAENGVTQEETPELGEGIEFENAEAPESGEAEPVEAVEPVEEAPTDKPDEE